MTLKGIFAPTLTPVRSDLSPDAVRLAAHCRRLLQEGCHGLAVFGTTSEANSFSVEERMAVLDQLVEDGLEPARLMPGTGCSALPDTVRLTAHATGLGCAGVLMLPPFYYKSVSDDGLFRSYAEVIERVGDGRLRIYLYHIPPISQVPISLSLIERLRAAYPNTVVGIKDSSGDWNNLKALLTNFPGFGTFSGSEAFLLETLRHGGVGTICAPANVIAGPLRKLYDHWQSDAAQQMQADVLAVRQATQALKLQPIPALKAIVARRLDVDDPAWYQVRPPLTPLAQAQGDALMAALAGKL